MLTSKISRQSYGFEVHRPFEYKQDYFIFTEMDFYYSVGVGPCAYEYVTVVLFYGFIILTNNHDEVSDTDTQYKGKDKRRRGILDHLRQFG